MVEITYDAVADIVTANYTKQVDLAELVRVAERLDLQFSAVPELYILHNFTEAKLIFDFNIMAIELAELRSAVEKLVKVRRLVTAAAVAGSDSNEMLVRLFLALSENIDNFQFKIFGDVKEAKAWLGH